MADTPSSPDKGKAPNSPQPGGLVKFWKELRRRHVVRVAAVYAIVGWLVIQVANATFADFGIPVWAYRFVVLMVVLGFPISLVVAWAFELTPEGIKTSKTAREEHPESHKDESHAKKRHWFSLGLAAAVPTLIFSILALVFYIRSGGDAEVTNGDKSIAVLPFDNRSNREEDQFFTDGIHDDLLTHISQISDIDTRSRTSVMGYRDTVKNMKTIADELGVVNILEGGVQRVGDTIRINVQLIDARTDSHIWAEIYNREMTLDNLFDIQTEIAVRIAGQLKAVISPEEKKRIEKKPTESLEALEAFFKGRDIYYSTIRTRRSEAIDLLNKAVELDPEFTMAYVYLGLCHLTSSNPADNIIRETSLDKAESAATRVLQLDDSLAEVHMLWGKIYYSRYPGGSEDAWNLAKTSFEKALEINPNYAEGIAQYAEFLTARFNIRDAALNTSGRRLFQRAVDLDPQNANLRLALGSFLRQAGDYKEAQDHLEASIRINPDLAEGYWQLALLTSSCYGRYDEVISLYRKSLEVDPLRWLPYYMLSVCYEMLGDLQESYRWHKPGASIGFTDSTPALSSQKYRISGDKEQWLRELHEVFQDRPSWVYRRHLLNMDLREGRAEIALERYKSVPFFSDLFEEEIPVFVNLSKVKGAMEVAEILIQTGDKERAYYLLDQAWDVLQYYPREGWTWYYSAGYGVRDATIHALKGDKRQALDALKVAIDGGFRDRWELESAALDTIREEPEFKALMEIVEADWAKQLANVRGMEANGKLAAIPEQVRKLMEEEN